MSQTAATFDDRMNRFRLAAREIFNQYFRVSLDDNMTDPWDEIDKFSEVEAALFNAIVAKPFDLETGIYHQRTLTEVGVRARHGDRIPAMLNRGIDSGSWDHPVSALPSDIAMTFVHFFDWDQTDYIDYRYARVVIDEANNKPELSGKHALIETQYVEFFLKAET